MKILVDEMPSYIWDCPFSELIELSRTIKFNCKITKEFCDLDCGTCTCSCLKVLETKE